MRKIPFSPVLYRRDGSGGRKFLFRRCTEEDIPAILGLQELVYRGLKQKDILIRITEEELRESLKFDRSLAAETEGALAAFSLVTANRVSDRNLGVYLGLKEEELSACATYEITFVHPDYRGYGLQRRFIRWKDEEAKKMGAKWALCTVSPDNPRSLENTLGAGFSILREMEMYGGVRRYILQKSLH